MYKQKELECVITLNPYQSKKIFVNFLNIVFSERIIIIKTKLTKYKRF